MKESSIIKELDSFQNFLADIKNERLFHSIMLINNDKIFLMEYAKALAGEILQNAEKVEKRVHPDLFIFGEDKPMDTAMVKDMLDTVFVSPYEGDKKVYIIDSFDEIGTVPANKLLKTIEEPPSGVVFILLVKNTSKVLQTLLSRAQKFYLEGFGQESVAELLKDKGIKNGELLSLETNGNLAEAITLAQSQKYEDMAEFVLRTLKSFKLTADFSRVLVEAEEFKENPKELFNLFSVILELMLRARAGVKIVAPDNMEAKVMELSKIWNNRAIVQMVEQVIMSLKMLESNVGVTNCYDQFFLKILEVRRKCRV